MTTIAFDIDDCLYPWYDNAHSWCIKHGLIAPETPRPRSWAPYVEYKVEAEEWHAALDAATEEGNHLYLGDPFPGAAEAVKKARDAGLGVVFITARGQFKNGDRIKALTREWVARHFPGVIKYNEPHFTNEKGPLAHKLGVKYAIDDSMRNIDSLARYGIVATLHTQTWNEDQAWLRRVAHVEEFVDNVIRLEGLA